MDDLDGRLHSLLAEHYGFTAFRPLQLEAIRAVLDQRDVLLILPTGGGKSLTFQLPPLVHGRLTIVITPLLALAKDQVEAANDRNIEAGLWCGSVTSASARDTLARDILDESGSLRLLYTTPESIQSSRLLDLLKTVHEVSRKICCVAVDEAHACVAWGRDFRQSYLSLGSTLQKALPGVPQLAVTATATPNMRQEIMNILQLNDPLTLLGTCNRPELEFAVKFKELMGGNGGNCAVIDEAIAFVKRRKLDSGIVYCRLRKTCETVADAFVSADIDAAPYHAGIDHSKRQRVQREWKEGAIQVVVATVAFGMGVDKSDVRWVLHMDPPSSLEGLYQEAGRGGRDGQPACCVVYASHQDLQHMAKLTGKADKLAAYVYGNSCRRAMLLEHFGESRMKCCPERGDLLCDVCNDPGSVNEALNKLQSLNASIKPNKQIDSFSSIEGNENDEKNSNRGLTRPLSLKGLVKRKQNDSQPSPHSDCKATARQLRHALHATLGQHGRASVPRTNTLGGSGGTVRQVTRSLTEVGSGLPKRRLPFKPPRPKSPKAAD